MAVNPRRFSVSDIMYGTSDCRRAWYLSREWDVRKPIVPFFLGDIVHKGLEIYYTLLKSADSVPETVEKLTANYAQSQLVRLEDRLGALYGQYSEEYEEVARRGVQVVKHYLEYEASHPLSTQIVDIEKKFALPFQEFTISGRIDLVIRRPDDRLWIVDHKTTSGTFDDRGMDLDEQVTAYLWAARRVYGEVPAGIIFNSIWSSPPEPPMKLSGKGSLKLSKSKSQPTTSARYRAEIEALGLVEEDYSEFLDYLDIEGWGRFFHRTETRRNEHEIDSFAARLVPKLDDLRRMINEPSYAYPSPSIYRCPKCQFLNVCKSIEDGSDWLYLLENGNSFVKR